MIYETNIPDYFDNTNVMNLNEVKFRMAFTVEGFLDKKRKDDPRYVKYLLGVKGRVDGDRYERFFPYHECTADDFLKFYPIDTRSKSKFDSVNEGEGRGFFCVDWEKEDIEIWDGDKNNNQWLSIYMLPCNIVIPEYGITQDDIAEECVGDLEEQKAYLGPINLIFLVNDESYDSASFGDGAII